MSNPIQLYRRAFVRAALATAGALAVSDSKAGLFDGGETKPPYPVTTSILAFGRQIGVQRIFWLDNDRVLIPAQAAELHKGSDGKEEQGWSALGLYIWNVKTNSHTRYADLYNVPRLFQYDHGEIAYKIDDPKDGHGTFVVMVGKMGQEKRLTLAGGFANHPELESSMGPGVRFRHEDGNIIVRTYALKRDHGYIFVGSGPTSKSAITPGNPEDWVKLYRPGQTNPINLPIRAKEMYSAAEFSYQTTFINMFSFRQCHARVICRNLSLVGRKTSQFPSI